MSDIKKVLITCNLGAAAMERFAGEPGVEAVVKEIKDEKTLVESVPGFDGLILRSNVKVTEDAIVAGERLKVIGRAGIGVDNIDIPAATKNGVAVVNAPSGNMVTTAEHSVAMLMSLARRIPQASSSMKESRWEKKRFMGTEIRNKTLGVIGAGRIGSTVANLGKGLNMKAICFDPFLTVARAEEMGVEKVDLDTLLERADFITLHTPLTPETKGLIGRDSLSKVKPGVFIINCARGGIVDLDALLEAIEDGRVAGAALDVFDEEPPPAHPLFAREEVVLTPHLGASTVEAQESVALEIADNVIAFLTTGVSPNTLNLPSVPVETFKKLAPHLDLAKQLGLFAVQMAEGPIAEAAIRCRGHVAEDGMELMTSALLTGLLTPAMEEVNIVNATTLAEQRGINVFASTSSATDDFTEMVSVEISGRWGKTVLEGALVGKNGPRLVFMDGFRIDAVPRGDMVVVYNHDVPGVIGAVGTVLGNHGLNIAGLYNGREALGGKALTIVSIDSTPDDAAISDLKSLDNVVSVKHVKL